MKMRRLFAILLVLCIVLGIATACNGGDKKPSSSGNATVPGESTDDPGSEVKYKDTIIMAVASDQNYMDGQMNNTNDLVLRTVYEALINRNSNNEIVPCLATDWETSEDGLVWTFHLRDDVYFHNGKKFTSADVKASYDRLLNEAEPVRYTPTMAGVIKECNVVDEYTVELVTHAPAPMFLPTLAHRANLILDAEYIEEYGADLGLTAESCNGTGPYVLKEWNMGEGMVFEAHEKYWRGPAHTKNLILKVVPEQTSAAIALENKEIDIAAALSAQDAARLDADKNDGIDIHFFPYQGLHGFQFNCAHPILQDTRLRQAVSYAIDRVTMVEALYSELDEQPATGPLGKVVWGYHDFGVIEQDLEKAKELMADAGYPDGFEFSIMVYEGYNKGLASAEMIQADLKKVGIEVTLDIVDDAGFKGSMAGRTFPGDNFPWGMFIMGYGPGTGDADEGLRRIWTTSEHGDNNNNYGWYSNTEVDELLLKAATEMDETVRKDLYRQAMQIIYIDDPAAVFTNERKMYFASRDYVEDLESDMRKSMDYWLVKARDE